MNECSHYLQSWTKKKKPYNWLYHQSVDRSIVVLLYSVTEPRSAATYKCFRWTEVILGFFELKGSVKEPNILIYFFFPPIIQSCSVSDVLFTGGRGVSDFSVLKCY